ncbi:MAG: immunity protein Imm33 domain-containing protein [Candidatus Cyclobacteriaceae bacterium M2_1C_046]
MAAFFKNKRGKAKLIKEFKDPPNTAVFTTKFVTEEYKPITYVSHDDDGSDWQFFSNDDFKELESIARIVSLQEIINLDPSIRELADMPVGYYATRKSKDDKWIIHKHE